MSSNDARPETTRIISVSGSRSSRIAQPTTLSTALCRPTSSRTQSTRAVQVEQTRRVQATGLGEGPLLLAEPAPAPARATSAGTGRLGASGKRRVRGAPDRCWSAPQTPQALVVSTLRLQPAVGGCAPSARRDVQDVVGVHAVRAGAGAVARQHDVRTVGDDPLAVQQAVHQVDVVAGVRMVTTNDSTVQPDLQRLLDGDRVDPRAGRGPVPTRTTGCLRVTRPMGSS